MRGYRRAALSIAAGALAFAMAAPAKALTERDCTEAITAAEENMPQRFGDDDRGQHVETMLAQAGEAGLQGDYQKCLEIVRDAEGAAGETELLRKSE